MEFEKVTEEICQRNVHGGLTPHPNGVIQAIYWAEDNNGNINFDIESIRDEFEFFLSGLEEYNEKSDFDWDNI